MLFSLFYATRRYRRNTLLLLLVCKIYIEKPDNDLYYLCDQCALLVQLSLVHIEGTIHNCRPTSYYGSANL